MFALAGMLLVLAAVIGGFLLENGDLLMLLQPAEFLIIVGGAAGTLMTANPPAVLLGMARGVGWVLRKKRFTHDEYIETLRALYALFQFARRNTGNALEQALDSPVGSAPFRGNCALVRDADIRDFVCDTLRTAVSGVVSPRDLDVMLETDLEVREHELGMPVESLGTVGETLPGLGIVAAVLGVLITMAHLGGPPAEVGEGRYRFGGNVSGDCFGVRPDPAAGGTPQNNQRRSGAIFPGAAGWPDGARAGGDAAAQRRVRPAHDSGRGPARV